MDGNGSKAKTIEQADQIARDLARIRRAIRQPLDAEIAKGQLTAPQQSVMQVVVRFPGLNLRDLSLAVSLAHSTVSGIVDRLEKRGMIERRPHPHDGRFSSIYPTAVVTDWVRDSIPRLTRGPLELALNRATSAERDQIAAALKRLRELLEPS